MKGKGTLWVWVGVLLVFLAGSGFVGYKLYKRQQSKKAHQRWEVKREMTLNNPLDGEELEKYLESENERLDRYEVIRPVVDELDLVTCWGVADADAAMAKLRECSEIRAGGQPGIVVFVVYDKDKELTGKLAQAMSKSYKAMRLRERLLPPMPPAGYGE